MNRSALSLACRAPLLVLMTLAISRPAPAQVSIPIRWCALAGSPAASDPSQTDALLVARTRRASRIWWTQSFVSFRSAARAGIVGGPHIPIIADPCPPGPGCPGVLGDVQTDVSFGGDSPSAEWRTAQHDCLEYWRETLQTTAGVPIVNVGHFVYSSGVKSPLRGGTDPPVFCNPGALDSYGDYCLDPTQIEGYSRQDVSMAIQDHATLSGPVDPNDITLAHELGHALALGHGDGLDNDGDTRFDSCCDPFEGETGSSLMSPTAGSISLLTPLQAEWAYPVAVLSPGAFWFPFSTPSTQRYYRDVRSDPLNDGPSDRSVDLAWFELAAEAGSAGVSSFTWTVFDSLTATGNREYDVFLDRDNNAATGGSPSVLGFSTAFAGAEVAVKVLVNAAGALAPSVWTYSGGAWFARSSPAIRASKSAYGYGLIAAAVPDSIVGTHATHVRVQAVARRTDTADLDRLPAASTDGLDFSLVPPDLPTCQLSPDTASVGESVSLDVTGLLPLQNVKVIMDATGGTVDTVLTSQADAGGNFTGSFVVPGQAQTGWNMVSVLGLGSALTSECALAVSPPRKTCAPDSGFAICIAPGLQSRPIVTSIGPGGVIVVWEDSRSGTSDIYAQRLYSPGQIPLGWPVNGVGVCVASGAQSSPAVTADGSGGVIIAWSDTRSGTADIYAQRLTGSGVPAVGWPANGLAICTATGTQTFPAIASDGAGGAIIVWADQRAGNFDIYARRVTGAGTLAGGWPVDGVALCTAAGDQGSPVGPEAISDAAGGAIAAWQDARLGTTNWDVYAHRVTGAGSIPAGWSVNGVLLSGAAGNQLSPSIASDGGGGAIVAWDDSRDAGTTGLDTYAQRVLPSGAIAPGWSLNGSPLSRAAGSQSIPKLCRDNAGGVFAAWNDSRGVDADIYGQRMTAAGTVALGWNANGVPLCTGLFAQSSAAIVEDGGSGAFVTWHDGRNGTLDIYAQRITGLGQPAAGWPVNGVGVGVGANQQRFPGIASTGNGRAMLAWQDRRLSLQDDIFGQCIGDSTYMVVGVPTPEAPSAPGFRVSSPAPNPSHGRSEIEFELAAPRSVEIQVFSASGRLIRNLVPSRLMGAGPHRIVWDGKDRLGRDAAAGVYLVRVRGGETTLSRKVVLVR